MRGKCSRNWTGEQTAGLSQQSCSNFFPVTFAVNDSLTSRLSPWRYMHLLLSAGTPAAWCPIYPAHRVLSSKPAGRRCCCHSMGQTDGRPLCTVQAASIAVTDLLVSWAHKLLWNGSTSATIGVGFVRGRQHVQWNLIATSDRVVGICLLVGRQEEHPACKNWVTRCWCGYLSGARCRLFAYGPADASAIPISPSSLASFKSRSVSQLMPLPLTVSCFSKIQIGFTFLVPAYPGSHR